jgi:hypothetical protein
MDGVDRIHKTRSEPAHASCSRGSAFQAFLIQRLKEPAVAAFLPMNQSLVTADVAWHSLLDPDDSGASPAHFLGNQGVALDPTAACLPAEASARAGGGAR